MNTKSYILQVQIGESDVVFQHVLTRNPGGTEAGFDACVKQLVLSLYKERAGNRLITYWCWPEPEPVVEGGELT